MRAIRFAVPALACWALLGFALPAGAAEPTANDPAYSALLDFAQKVGASQATRVSAVQPAPAKTGQPSSKDAVYDELRSFAQELGSAKRQSTDKPIRLARRGNAAATFVGSAKCATCHAKSAAEFAKTMMGKIGVARKGTMECENCHGPGSEHVRLGGGKGVGGMYSFGKDDPRPVEEQNASCLACHQKGGRTYWAGSVHETRGLSCSSCHTVMKNVSRKKALKTRVEAETCYQCHKSVRAEMLKVSHMPVREGKLSCSNCHNPHGSAADKQIREATVNDNCYKCHAEKRGPLLFEHAPVRESCLNCHTPHGSIYGNLLKVARPRLCNECHNMVHSSTGGGGFGYPSSPYTMGFACGNCHSAVHGSNHPAGAFFLR